MEKYGNIRENPVGISLRYPKIFQLKYALIQNGKKKDGVDCTYKPRFIIHNGKPPSGSTPNMIPIYYRSKQILERNMI